MTKKLIHKNLLLVLALFSLVSCVTTQTDKTSGSSSIYTNLDGKSPDYYLSEADKRQGTDKAPWKLKAAAAFALNNNLTRSYQVLKSFHPTELAAKERDSYYLLMGESALAQQQPYEAIRALQAISQPNSHSKRWNAHYYNLLADSLVANNRLADAAMTRIQSEHLLDSLAQAQQQHEKAWKELSLSPVGSLEQKLLRATSTKEAGWLTMAIIQKRYATAPRNLAQAMNNWGQEFPNHPAINYIDERSVKLGEVEMVSPRKVALFLPLSGPVAGISDVIKDGFLAAHYENRKNSELSDIVVYDTTSGDSIETLYQKALADNVDFVVGPLLKHNVEQVAFYSNLPIPTLVLNRLDSSALSDRVFQFGLPIEDESVQIADHAIRNNQTRAFIINADNSVGARAVNAFKDAYIKAGGTIIKEAEIDESQDPKEAIMRMLGADQVEKRKEELQNLLSLPVESSGQVTNSADFIFLVSKADKARIIKPYLNYYYAYNLPIYATSTIYNGSSSVTRDNDLEGIRFPDSPWMIGSSSEIRAAKEQLSSLIKHSTSSAARFFALGHDAYNLVPELQQMSVLNDYSIAGLSGLLFMDQEGKIHRQLSWGQYRRGKVVPVQ